MPPASPRPGRRFPRQLALPPAVLCRLIPRLCTATIVLLRHAEPVDGTDPGLSPAGLARVEALVHALESMGVDAVFHSEFRRTRETAEAVAVAAGITPEEVGAGDIDVLVSRLRGLPRGSTAVVIGHTDTVPPTIERLGGGTVPPIGAGEFDNLYIVDRAGGGPTHHLHYGAKT